MQKKKYTVWTNLALALGPLPTMYMQPEGILWNGEWSAIITAFPKLVFFLVYKNTSAAYLLFLIDNTFKEIASLNKQSYKWPNHLT